jgi:hypothetical protein
VRTPAGLSVAVERGCRHFRAELTQVATGFDCVGVDLARTADDGRMHDVTGFLEPAA